MGARRAEKEDRASAWSATMFFLPRVRVRLASLMRGGVVGFIFGLLLVGDGWGGGLHQHSRRRGAGPGCRWNVLCNVRACDLPGEGVGAPGTACSEAPVDKVVHKCCCWFRSSVQRSFSYTHQGPSHGPALPSTSHRFKQKHSTS